MYGLAYKAIITVLHRVTEIRFTLPRQPISIIGIAVSFYLGLRNNSSYDRTREARKIRGAIVNDSRTFANAVITLLHENPDENIDAIKKSIVYRDLAWAVSLRYMLRIPKTWEHKYGPKNTVFVPTYNEMMNNGLDKELPEYFRTRAAALQNQNKYSFTDFEETI